MKKFIIAIALLLAGCDDRKIEGVLAKVNFTYSTPFKQAVQLEFQDGTIIRLVLFNGTEAKFKLGQKHVITYNSHNEIGEIKIMEK
jgi:hypothetical protein